MQETYTSTRVESTTDSVLQALDHAFGGQRAMIRGRLQVDRIWQQDHPRRNCKVWICVISLDGREPVIVDSTAKHELMALHSAIWRWLESIDGFRLSLQENQDGSWTKQPALDVTGLTLCPKINDALRYGHAVGRSPGGSPTTRKRAQNLEDVGFRFSSPLCSLELHELDQPEISAKA